MRARTIFAWQLGLIALLCAPYAVDAAYNVLTDRPGHLPFVHPGFDLDEEMNPPALFSALAWLAVAAASLALAMREHGAERLAWVAAAAVAAFIAIDEAVQVHEQIANLIADAPATGFLWWPWVTLYGGLALAALACAWPTFRRMAQQDRTFILAGAGVFLVGAVGFEIIGAAIIADKPYYAIVADPPTKYRLSVLCEEALEMLGVALALRGLLSAGQRRAPISREPAALARSQPH